MGALMKAAAVVLVAGLVGCGGSGESPVLGLSRLEIDAGDGDVVDAGPDAHHRERDGAAAEDSQVEGGSRDAADSGGEASTCPTSCAGTEYNCGSLIIGGCDEIYACGECQPGWTCVLAPGHEGNDAPGTCESFCAAGQHQCSDGGCSPDPCD
jgi:hypothetical protein